MSTTMTSSSGDDDFDDDDDTQSKKKKKKKNIAVHFRQWIKQKAIMPADPDRSGQISVVITSSTAGGIR